MVRNFRTIFSLCCALLLWSCAKMGSPSGGEKDVEGPKIISASPANKSINVSPKEIVLEFDEYVVLGNYESEWIISPPLKKKPKVKLKSKTLIISLTDSLEENTTYSFNFGESIKDLHEGNLLKENLFVFSTGSFLDSGMVSGNTLLAEKDEKAKDISIGLYLGTLDSLPPDTTPRYYAKSDENGYVSIPFLKDTAYTLLAWEDANKNKKIDGTEKRGFLDDLIRPGTSDSLKIRVFAKKVDSLRIEKEKLIDNKKVLIQFNGYPLSQSFAATGDSLAFVDRYTDSVVVWYQQQRTDDSLVLELADSSFTERLVFYPFVSRKKKEGKLNIVEKNLPKKPSDIGYLFFNEPLLLDTFSMSYTIGKDTIPQVLKANRTEYSNKYEFENPLTFGQGLKMQILPLQSIYGTSSDTITFIYGIPEKTGFGNLILSLTPSSKLQNTEFFFLFGQEKNLVKYPSNGLSFNRKFLGAGTYQLFLVIDKDGDGKYSTGIMEQGIQPDPVYKFKEPIEIRENWDLELQWTID